MDGKESTISISQLLTLPAFCEKADNADVRKIIMKTLDKIIIVTKHLVLRPLTVRDVEELYAIYSDSEVMKFWNTTPWTKLAQARELIDKDADALNTGSHLRLGIEAKEEKKLIGTCILFSFNNQCRRAEIGYILAKSFWGHEFMNEALSAFINHAFSDMKLHRIEADIDPRNHPSAKILKHLGFIKEGHLRERWIINDEVSDSFLYGLLSKDWIKLRKGEK